MTPARLWRVVGVLAVIVVGGFFFGGAHYHDDSRTQVWEVEAGFAVFRYGLVVLVVATLGAVIWSALDGRRPPRS